MHMLALPIARRELLVLSRAPSSWRNRLVISVLVFAFGSGFAVLYRFAGQMALNQAMQMLGGGLSMYCLFVGVALTADSLAREKREGTLGLLFLTNLSSFEIALGKLLAHSLVGFYSLLCVLPLLSMSMIFGGMRFGDVLLYMISALDTLFFSAAVGIFVSAICREQRKASGYGMLIVLFFWWGMPLLRMLLAYTAVPGWLMTCLSFVSINPVGSYPGLPLMAMPSAWNLAWTHALAWAFIGLAVWLLPRRWQDVPVEKGSLLRRAWKGISLGKPATRLKLRRALVDQNPFLWLASRDRFQAAGMWITSIAMTIFVAWNFRKAPQAETLIALAVILSWAQQGFFSGAAASQLLQEYEQGTLEMLLSTPLSVHEVARGQWAAVLRQNRSAFALTFLLLVIGCVWLISRLGLREPIAPAALVIYSGLFLLQLYALGWVGMWAIVTAPEPRKARTRAFLCITGAPVLMFGALIGIANFLSWLAGIRLRFPPELLPFVFLAIAFVNSILWLRHAKRQLPEQLRLFAFRRYAPQEPLTLLGRIGRAAGRWFRRKRSPARALSGAMNTLT
jgi:ABC-type Na+ efflux pump permease subunit